MARRRRCTLGLELMSSVDTAVQPAVARDRARSSADDGPVAVTCGFFALAHLGRDLSYGWGPSVHRELRPPDRDQLAVRRSEQLAMACSSASSRDGLATAPTIAYASTNPQWCGRRRATALFILGFGAPTQRAVTLRTGRVFGALALIVFGSATSCRSRTAPDLLDRPRDFAGSRCAIPAVEADAGHRRAPARRLDLPRRQRLPALLSLFNRD